MVIVINSVIGGFSWVDLVWLATSTVRLKVSDYSQLSDYNCTEWLVKNEVPDAPIIFEEIVIVMIKAQIGPVITNHVREFLIVWITPKINTWHVIFTERQGKSRFEVFPPESVTREKLFKTHVTRKFFENSCVKRNQDPPSHVLLYYPQHITILILIGREGCVKPDSSRTVYLLTHGRCNCVSFVAMTPLTRTSLED